MNETKTSYPTSFKLGDPTTFATMTGNQLIIFGQEVRKAVRATDPSFEMSDDVANLMGTTAAAVFAEAGYIFNYFNTSQVAPDHRNGIVGISHQDNLDLSEKNRLGERARRCLTGRGYTWIDGNTETLEEDRRIPTGLQIYNTFVVQLAAALVQTERRLTQI